MTIFYLKMNWVSIGKSYEFGSNIVKMSKASKDGECFLWLRDKATQMNLKGKG
jgi:alpha-glucosidase